MKTIRHAIPLLLLAVAAGGARADIGPTRQQVLAKLEEARRTGDLLAPGDSGLRLNELYPQRYPRTVVVSTRTRAEVRAAFEDALRRGDVLGSGDSGLTRYEMAPTLYPARVRPPSKTREQVRAERDLARELGDVDIGEDGRTAAERSPQRYADVRARHAAEPQAGS